MRSSAMRLFFVCLTVAFAFGAAAQSSDPFALTPPLVSQAITSCGDLTVSDGLIDSSATAGKGSILSNGNIKVSGGKVDGDVTAGPGKTVTRSGSGTITGLISSATTAFPCSIIDLGALSVTLSSMNDNASIPLSAQHKNPVSSAGDFTLSGGDSLTLQAGTYYFHKFTMSGGSRITLAGSVRILTTSDVNISGGSVAGDASWKLRFWSSGTKFTVSSSTFVGFVYAPSAAMTVSSGVLSGGIYGGGVTVSGGSSHVTRTLDDTPPQITITAPTDGEPLTDLTNVIVHGKVVDTETALTSFTVNGTIVTPAGDGTFSVTISLGGVPANIVVNAKNAAGLTATTIISVQAGMTQILTVPTSLIIDQNSTGQLRATATYADGTTSDVTSTATWTSTAPAIATVNGGVVTGVHAGTTTITATFGSLSATSTVTVNAILQTVVVSPTTSSLAIGATQPFSASATYSDGTTKDVTQTAAWSTTDGTVVTVATNGVATALGAGTATIRATQGSIVGSAAIVVIGPPTITTALPVRGKTSGGDTVVISGTNFGTSGNTRVTLGGTAATVTTLTSTSITVTTPTHAAGTVDIVVTAPGGAATAASAFTYIAPPSLTGITPSTGKSAGGDTVTLTGTNFDAASTTLTIGGVAATNVSVLSAISVTATTPAGLSGVADVALTTAGGTTSIAAAFTYVPPPVIASVAPLQALAGSSIVVTGQSFDPVAANNHVTIAGVPATVTSASATQLVVTVPVNATAGTVQVSTLGGSATSAQAFTPLTYQGITLSTTSVALQVGGQQRIAASALLSDGSALDVSTIVAWRSRDASIATVTAGTVGAVGVGTTSVTATLGAFTASATVSVSPTLQSIAVSPATATAAAGAKQLFTATATYSDNTTKDVTSTVAWSSTNTGIATIDTSGIAMSLSPGTTTIQAAIGAITGSATFTVQTAGPPTVTSVIPAKGRTAGGDTVTITGTGFGTASDTTARFGSANATIVAITPTSITLTTPAGAAGSIAVTVTTSLGSTTVAQAFTYLAPPTILNVIPFRSSTLGGQTIQINGTNFDASGTTVVIGGNTIPSVTVNSSTNLSFMSVPGDAGNVNVTVTTAGGSVTRVGGFVYVAPPTITSFSPSAGQPGTQVTVNGTFDPTVRISFTGAAAATQTFLSLNSIVATVPANAVTGPIIATGAGGTAQSATQFAVASYTGLTISPASPQVNLNGTLAIHALASLSDGTSTDVTSQTVWSSDNTGVATIDAAGTAHGVAVGSTTIHATFNSFGAAASVTVAEAPPLDPVLTATAIDPTVATNFATATAFLYSSNGTQRGFAASIDPKRVVVLTGQVTTADGQPLSGVRITALAASDLGYTLSRADGGYDFVANGGGNITLVYQKSGFLTVHRAVTTPWNDYVIAPNVTLTPIDSAVTTINLSSNSVQSARGSLVQDSAGTRRATIAFLPGTTASLRHSDGTIQPITTLSVRATEFSVGPNGPNAMPAVLPASSGYTYCAEFSADEALASGSDVVFNRSIPIYIDNFLSFPVGERVPLGYYDRIGAQWLPYDDGRVIKILSVAGGTAAVDADGDGVPDSSAALATLGISSDELTLLAQLYTSGTTLWRVQVPHFSVFDCNYPVFAPKTAKSPKQKSPTGDNLLTGPCDSSGSIIQCENQVLGENIPLPGIDAQLHYQSDRGTGRKAAYRLDISLTDAQPPTSLKRVDLQIDVAGRRFTQSFSATPQQQTTFIWDGMDAFGRVVQGDVTALVTIGYVYDAFYGRSPAMVPQSFAAVSLSDPTLLPVPARSEIVFRQQMAVLIGGWGGSANMLGGWSLTTHHEYNPNTGEVLMGDGTRYGPREIGSTVAKTFGCQTTIEPCSFGTQNTQAKVTSMGFAPDGTLYVSMVGGPIYRLRNNVLEGVLGTNTIGQVVSEFCNDLSDSMNPVAVPLSATLPSGVRPDFEMTMGKDGTLVVTDAYHVMSVRPDGSFHVIAGRCSASVPGSLLGTDRQVFPGSPVIGPDGSVYFADGASHGIYRVDANGMLQMVFPASVRFTVDAGNRLFAQNYPAGGQISRVDADGSSTVVAGKVCFCPSSTYTGEGGPATDAIIGSPINLLTGPDGSLYFTSLTGRVHRVSPDGIITTVAGNGQCCTIAYGERPTATPTNSPWALAFAPDGTLQFSDINQYVVVGARTTKAANSNSQYVIGSPDGTRAFVFDSLGRHLRTVDALTGAVITRFTYDGAGRLQSIADAFNNTTQIQRDSGGNPQGIVAPGGQRTAFTTSNGLIASLTTPGAVNYSFEYNGPDLLTALVDPHGNRHAFTYDDDGRLTRDGDPAGGSSTLARTVTSGTTTVTKTTGVGRATTFAMVTDPDHVFHETITSAAGAITTKTIGSDGSKTFSTPNGAQLTTSAAADPRFGAGSALLGSMSARMPSGLTLTMQSARSVGLSNLLDPLSLTAVINTQTVNGKTWSLAYTASSRTLRLQTPTGRTRTAILTANGTVASIQRPGLATYSFTYDNRGALTAVDSGSRHLTLGYDPQLRLASVSDNALHSHQYQYDADGRMTSQTFADGRSVGFGYDIAGKLSSVTPPGRAAYTFSLTPVDLLAGYTPPAIGAPAPTTLDYNVDRQPATLHRPDATVSFGYDTGGRLSTVTEPLGIHRYTYRPGSGTLASISAPDGNSLAFASDGGLLTAMTWSGAVVASIGFTYDNSFRVVSETVDGDNAVTFAYDDDGLLLNAGALSLKRDASNGLLTGATLGNLADAWGYNAFGEITSHQLSLSSSPIITRTYTRDDAGHITQVTETLNGQSLNTTYSYDTAGRLTDVAASDGTTHYDYDSNGNRTSFRRPGGTTGATYDAQDRLVTYGDATYAYGDHGELATKTNASGTTRYVYDVFGNLRAVTLPSGEVVDYVIDPQNRRVGKKVNGVLIAGWIYDGRRIVAETDGTGAVTKRFVYGGRSSTPDYVVWAGSTYRILGDHVGSPRYVIEASGGTSAQSMTYDVLGNVESDSRPGFQPFGFAGGLYDADTKLVRFGARDYDPETGRWLSKDPGMFRGGDPNLYVYALNDPVNAVDPTGFISWQAQWWADLAENGNAFEKVAGAVFGTLAAAVPDSAGIGGDATAVLPSDEIGVGGNFGGAAQAFFNVPCNNSDQAGLFTFEGPVVGTPQASAEFQFNAAWSPNLNQGASSWSGPFDQVTFGAGQWSAGVFWSPDGNWIGISVGYGAGTAEESAEVGTTVYTRH